MIAIIDYGMGNIHSVAKALESLGARPKVVNRPQDLKNCEKIVLPGVGAFSDAMLELRKHSLVAALKEHLLKQKTAFLGICLGMQLLFPESEEAKKYGGLGILKGRVKRFAQKKALKVPHIGWNQLQKVSDKCPLLKGLADGAYVYFCHSYYPVPKNRTDIAATCNYGGDFASIVWHENIFGVQFHPEKSQRAGLEILRNFIDLC